jgi:hypothetical protein
MIWHSTVWIFLLVRFLILGVYPFFAFAHTLCNNVQSIFAFEEFSKFSFFKSSSSRYMVKDLRNVYPTLG